MSAIDELRRLLDERGVEYEGDKDVTRFFGYDGFEVVMQEDIDGKLDCLTPLYLTPEQAVEATLGSDLKAENAKLRELVDELYPLADYGAMDASELDKAHDLMRELGLEAG